MGSVLCVPSQSEKKMQMVEDSNRVTIIDVLQYVNQPKTASYSSSTTCSIRSVPISKQVFRMLSWQANKKILETKTKFKNISTELWKEIEGCELVGFETLMTIDYRNKNWMEKCVGCSWCGNMLYPMEIKSQLQKTQRCVMKELTLPKEIGSTYIHYCCCSSKCFENFTAFMNKDIS